MTYSEYLNDAVALLKSLIATPSVSRDECAAADIIVRTISRYGYEYCREGNNIWIKSKCFDDSKPTLLLNAHIDTVKPVSSWSRDPFMPYVTNGKLYGLGSNDCGGGLVSLLQVFRHITSHPQKFNTILLVSAEEEVSGENGISRALPLLPKIDVAIVGEPTGMQPAIAEKGLMVIDATAEGKSGHAARGEGVNAVYVAMDDIEWLRRYKFEKVSKLLGPTVANVTIINAGTQHNVIPDTCRFTIDIRTNEYYKNEDVFNFLSSMMKSQLKARSFRLSSSYISSESPLIKRCTDMGMTPFGSPTLSDQALMHFPSFKLGPGESSRSHSADEYIKINEIENAIKTYICLLDGAEI